MLSRVRLNDFRLVVAILLVIGGASACSSNNDDTSGQREVAPEPSHEIYRGPLYQAFRAIQESKNREKCDQKLSDIQNTLITALDSKAGELLNYSYSSQFSNPAELAPFAKSYLLKTEKKPAKTGWSERAYGWNTAYNYYLKHFHENTPVFWSTLNAYVRSIVTDDRKRVVYRYNLTLTYDHVEKLSSLVKTIESCKTNTRCSQPDWSEEQKQVISEVPAYAATQKQLDAAYFLRTRRTMIEKLHDQIQADYAFHRDDFNSQVSHRMVDGKHFYTLPLDASAFSANDRALLEKSITSVWNNDDNSLSIAWKSSTPAMGFFRFLFSYEPDNRSFVNFALKSIHLFPFNTTRVVAHEIGHVLGFSDHYYTLWDPEKCEYRSQYHEEDIMSVPDSGNVTAEEWKMLLDQYENR